MHCDTPSWLLCNDLSFPVTHPAGYYVKAFVCDTPSWSIYNGISLPVITEHFETIYLCWCHIPHATLRWYTVAGATSSMPLWGGVPLVLPYPACHSRVVYLWCCHIQHATLWWSTFGAATSSMPIWGGLPLVLPHPACHSGVVYLWCCHIHFVPDIRNINYRQ